MLTFGIVLSEEQFPLENENEIMAPTHTLTVRICRTRHRCASDTFVNITLF
jgi:hypothetical protein